MPLITHPALNLGPLLARQQNAIEMAFCWWADSGPFFGGGPLMARFSIVEKRTDIGPFFDGGPIIII